MRAAPWLLAIVLGWSGAAWSQAVSVMPATCLRQETLDAVEYQRRWRFLALGGGYKIWSEKDCYPPRLDEPALAKTESAIGYIASVGGRDVFVVNLDPVWFTRCKKTATPIVGAIPIDGATLVSLLQHLFSVPPLSSIDVREIGFGEAAMRDKRVLFALYVGSPDRAAYLECYEDLDAAVQRAAETLAGASSTSGSAGH